jgi:hypothetical protein
MENIKAETSAAPVAPTAPVESKSAVPAPGTPEFAAWAWENRNG